MTKTFEIEAPHGRRSRLPFPSFEQAVAGVVQGYEIVGEYDGSVATPGEYADSPSTYSGGELVALISREDPKNPLSKYIRTDLAKARLARLDAELVAFIQSEIDAGRLRMRRAKT